LDSSVKNNNFERLFSWAPAALQQGERPIKRAVGRRLVADESHELAKRREHRAALEERRLRPPGAPLPPGRVHYGLGEPLLAAVPRRQRRQQLRPKPLEISRILAEHHGCPRPQPMPQSIPARHSLAGGRPGPGALQGIAAVGGDLSGGGHDPAVLTLRRTGGLNNRQRPTFA
jgi:hypothetical protein